MRKLLRILAIVLLLLVAAAAALYLWLARGGRPQRDGRAEIAGLGAAVEVRYDAWGVPAIRAGSAEDAMAALGWVHANDRLFQMELTRRAATGRLAELVGERALAFDRRVRENGFGHAPERLLESQSEGTRQLLEAYARGVNSWLAARGGDLPPEFRILRRRPEPWRPEDSLAVIFVMARNLSPVLEPPEEDLFRFLHALGPERARELAVDPAAKIFDEIAIAAKETASEPERLTGAAEAQGLGSNNWALAPSRSADGHALLANDPHLNLRLPSVWYQARIEAPDYDAAGMTLPGAPAVVLGRGPHLAWACTNLYVDDVDLFVEKLDPSGTRVARGDGWLPIAVERETIRAGGRDVAVEVRRTDRGVFLPADPRRGLPARSIAWTGWTAGDQLAAFVGLARATSAAEVPAIVAGYTFPAQNLVVASDRGEILWTPLGRGPKRFGWDGRFPAPGWRADVGWAGLVPAAENPVALDPVTGALATANSTLPVDRPAWFGEDFDTPYRVDRIRQLLAGRTDWTVARLATMQTDVESLWAREVVGAIGGELAGEAAEAARALRSWDGAMDSTGASALFALFERELVRDVFEDEATRAGLARFGTRKRLAALIEGRIAADWWDDVSTAAKEDRAQVVARALAAAWRRGAARWGSDVAAWRYADLHQLTLDHPLGGLPLVGRWFRRGPFGVPGSATTIEAFGGPWRGEAITVTYGASMRFVTDAAEPERTVAIVPGGQAGHPADAHYADQLSLYFSGGARPLAWSDAEIERTMVSSVRLESAGGTR